MHQVYAKSRAGLLQHADPIEAKRRFACSKARHRGQTKAQRRPDSDFTLRAGVVVVVVMGGGGGVVTKLKFTRGGRACSHRPQTTDLEVDSDGALKMVVERVICESQHDAVNLVASKER